MGSIQGEKELLITGRIVLIGIAGDDYNDGLSMSEAREKTWS